MLVVKLNKNAFLWRIIMQKLQFEEAWDKTISEKDRSFIKEIFKMDMPLENRVLLSPFWLAKNYKKEWLLSALIHNGTNEVFTISNHKISIVVDDQVVHEAVFSVPRLEIKPFTSMSWTFIFPSNEKLEEILEVEDRYVLTNQKRIRVCF